MFSCTGIYLRVKGVALRNPFSFGMGFCIFSHINEELVSWVRSSSSSLSFLTFFVCVCVCGVYDVFVFDENCRIMPSAIFTLDFMWCG